MEGDKSKLAVRESAEAPHGTPCQYAFNRTSYESSLEGAALPVRNPSEQPMASSTEPIAGPATHSKQGTQFLLPDIDSCVRMPEAPGKMFPTLQGAIKPSEFSRFYVVHRTQSDQCLLDLIESGKFVLLHGHRMCGKSTRIRLLIEGNSKSFRGI